MPKRLALLAFAFALLAVSAAAEPACKGAADFSWLLAPVPEVTEGPGIPLAPPAEALDLASVQRTGSGAHTRCSVTASCGSYNINCSVPGTGCSGHDRACPTYQGHVTCNGVTTWCEPACPVCNEGSFQWMATGGCCDDLREQEKFQCIGGQWQPLGVFRCRPPLCGPV